MRLQQEERHLKDMEQLLWTDREAHVQAVQELHANPAHQLLRQRVRDLDREEAEFRERVAQDNAHRGGSGENRQMGELADGQVLVSLAPYPLDAKTGRAVLPH